MKADTGSILKNLMKDSENVFLPQQPNHNKPQNMLIIIPDLKLGGTLTVLMELFSLFDECGYQLFVISSEDGPYRERLVEFGAVVVIRPYVACTEHYRHFLQSAFDCVFINSASCYFYIYYFINTDTNTIWWLHETKTQLETFQGFPHLGLMSSNIRLAGVTHAVCHGIENLYGLQINSLPMPLADHLPTAKKHKAANNKTIFFIPAAYTYIKGQDILLQAIAHLPTQYIDKSSFILCGYQLPGQMPYYNNLKKIASLLKNVIILDELDKAGVYEYYQQCDCVIAPSRVDATPTTIVEAMMFEKPCIVSDAAGISEYMQDCVNGLIFPSENIPELQKRILLVIENPEIAKDVAKQGRKVYENNFSVPAVSEKLKLLNKDLF